MGDRKAVDIIALLDYLWIDESRHYRESRRKNHIFMIMKRIAKEIDYSSRSNSQKSTKQQ